MQLFWFGEDRLDFRLRGIGAGNVLFEINGLDGQ
jgi:hypothetical protein